MFQRISVIILLLLAIAALNAVPVLALSPAVKTIQQAQTSSAPLNNQDVIGMVRSSSIVPWRRSSDHNRMPTAGTRNK